MALNAGKCHFICLGKDTRNETFIFKGLVTKNSKEQKILGVTMDKLTFKSHIKNLCKKASQKIRALSRFSNHLNDSQKSLILNSVVKSQFSYCRLVWMFCSRTSNNMINKVHESALRVLLNDNESDFETLMQINNDVCNHHRNIQAHLIEIFKIKKDFAPAIMGSILKGRTNIYNVRNFQEFETERKRTVYFVLETISYRSP